MRSVIDASGKFPVVAVRVDQNHVQILTVKFDNYRIEETGKVEMDRDAATRMIEMLKEALQR